MAITGAWKAQQSVEAGASKWGTGVSPVHAIRTEGPPHYEARLTAPNFGSATLHDVVPTSVTEHGEDWVSDWEAGEELWGYNDETGMSLRPRMDGQPAQFRGVSQMTPYDESGNVIRSEERGAVLLNTMKVTPEETVSEGWLNKVEGQVLDSVDASTDQLYMNTSMKQRDAVRAGSQTAGRASEFSAPIKQRIAGMRLKVFSGEARHYDMTPRRADEIIRPWWSRQAGTPPQDWLPDNASTLNTPMTRTPPVDPYTGEDASQLDSYGYTDEDLIPYA